MVGLRPWIAHLLRLEVVSYPEIEAAFTKLCAAAVCSEQDVLPALVEKGSPSPVKVDRKAERHGLKAKAVGATRVS